MSNKAWGGRFEVQPEEWVDDFNASITFDQTLIDQDIEGSIAHATMLGNQGIISQQDSEQIIQGLKSIQHDYHQDQIQFSASLEDIHLNIEHELIKRIGDAGGKLHTGRSRNDQVATDMHLYTKKQVQDIITLSDAFSTGSSIMPQKKNPDMAELIRGKVGRTTGHLMSMLMTLKGLPLAYNKDMQEDKEGLFDAVHTIKGSLRIFEGMIQTMTINKERLNQTVKEDFSNATELADYLVTKNIPFRTAHEIVGKIVLECIQQGHCLLDVPLATYQQHHSSIDADIYDYLQPENCLKRHQSYGSTGQSSVKQQLDVAKQLLSQ
ncbi:hypothetical protein CD170_08185 [Staphylococcus aureus]|nr:hypothetical protein CD170_08185 [Staphylococcus aureus]QOJ76356.1 argininosuccinate lyase [Staphylococcus aureus]